MKLCYVSLLDSFVWLKVAFKVGSSNMKSAFSCRKVLFGIEKVEADDNTMDLQMSRVCANELKSLCSEVPGQRVFKCLRVGIIDLFVHYIS